MVTAPTGLAGPSPAPSPPAAPGAIPSGGLPRQGRTMSTSTYDPSSRPGPVSPARRNRGWVWFFVALAGLTLLGITINWRFNLGQQLKREQLEEARADWKKNGAASYDLEY